jgi:AcrR family transcriptional regulator
MSKVSESKEKLLTAAIQAFGAGGFEAASLDDIAAQAGVTKGSLYHHFESKRGLFEAVYRKELARQVSVFRAAYAACDTDPWKAFRAGCRAYIETIMDSQARQIAIIDAPAVLGGQKVREIEDTQVIGLMKIGIMAAMDAGMLRKRPVDPVANLVFSALCEAASQLGRADDMALAHAEWTAELESFFDGLE